MNSAFDIDKLLSVCGYCSAIQSHYISPNSAVSPATPVYQDCALYCQYIFGITYEGTSACSMNQKLPTE